MTAKMTPPERGMSRRRREATREEKIRRAERAIDAAISDLLTLARRLKRGRKRLGQLRAWAGDAENRAKRMQESRTKRKEAEAQKKKIKSNRGYDFS